jgi:hypothetical protein
MEKRWDRLKDLSGTAALAFLAASAAMARSPTHLPEPARIVTNAQQNRWGVLSGGYMATVASLLLVFSARLRERLKADQGKAGVLPDVAFGGGVATSVLLGGASMLPVAIAERGPIDGRISPDVAAFANDVGSLMMGKAAPVTMAAMTGATTLVAHQQRTLPRWLTGSGAAITIGLLSPLNFLFVLFGLIWIAVLGAVLATQGTPAGSDTDATEVA